MCFINLLFLSSIFNGLQAPLLPINATSSMYVVRLEKYMKSDQLAHLQTLRGKYLIRVKQRDYQIFFLFFLGIFYRYFIDSLNAIEIFLDFFVLFL